MRPNPQFPVNLVTFTEKILNGKFVRILTTPMKLVWVNFIPKAALKYCVIQSEIVLGVST